MVVLVAAGATAALVTGCVTWKYWKGPRSQSTPTLSAEQRPVPVGKTEPPPTEKNEPKNEAERILAGVPEDVTVGDLVEAAGGTGWCFRRTLPGMLGHTMFSAMDSNTTGYLTVPAEYGVAYTCRKGMKEDGPNQDRACFLIAEGLPCIYAAFDGHGVNGHEVAQQICDTVVKLILKDARLKCKDEASKTEMLKEVFGQMQLLLRYWNDEGTLECATSGSSCMIALHDRKAQQLTVANVGDGTAIVVNFARKATLKLSSPQRPEMPAESERIEAAGGRVVFDGYASYQVFTKDADCPGLHIPRTLGATAYENCGAISEPQVASYSVGADDTFLIIALDGVTKFMENATIASLLTENKEETPANCDKIAKMSFQRWMKEQGGTFVDDITVVLAHLQNPDRPDSDEEFACGACLGNSP
eukprot:TRINITY_DN40482_c0_g1_i1.p1 TRINITY_DN40482_c0_g1~~TRINITY_DN40482_c0_g1_i1.p1  ORF type:complete len:416 (+),score=69.19 TRINITY_DN40482_c0_g1_i1:96-1343(+)